MKTLNEYLNNKQITRQIHRDNDGLDIIYKFMREDDKALLKSHKRNYKFLTDKRDMKPLKERYHLSWSEVEFIIDRYA